MSDLRTAAQQALEAMETVELDIEWRAASPTHKMLSKAITALRAALTEPVQEPVAWTTMPDDEDWLFISGRSDPNGKLEGKWYPLYTTPPQRKPLTEEEIDAVVYECSATPMGHEWELKLARAIERAHGIGEKK